MPTQKPKYQSTTLVNWDVTPELSGVVTAKGEEEVDKRKVQTVTLTCEDGDYRFLVAAMLEDGVKAADIGDTMHIKCLGLKKLEGGRSVRMFNVRVYAPEE